MCCTLFISIIVVVCLIYYKNNKISLDKPLSFISSDYPNILVPASNYANLVTVGNA